MKIKSSAYEGEGMVRVYENGKWMVGIKNWKPMNDLCGIDRLERHNETDESFVLIDGKCTLFFANETLNGLDINYVPMEPFKVYTIPATLWHNTVTQKDTKLILIEDSDTNASNSNELPLSNAQIGRIQADLSTQP